MGARTMGARTMGGLHDCRTGLRSKRVNPDARGVSLHFRLGASQTANRTWTRSIWVPSVGVGGSSTHQTETGTRADLSLVFLRLSAVLIDLLSSSNYTPASVGKPK